MVRKRRVGTLGRMYNLVNQHVRFRVPTSPFSLDVVPRRTSTTPGTSGPGGGGDAGSTPVIAGLVKRILQLLAASPYAFCFLVS